MSNVPAEFAELETLSQADLDREVQRLRQLDPDTLSEKELTRACALHAIARRRTSGPPKASKTSSKKEAFSLDSLATEL
jgi:hypothetical protein